MKIINDVKFLIVGLGLIGGSYGMALKRKGYSVSAITLDKESIDYAIKNNIIDTDRAEQWLFSPVVAYSIKEKDFSKRFISAMQYASELDACKKSEYYQDSIVSAANSFYAILKNNTHLSANTSPLKMLIDYKDTGDGSVC